MISSMTGFAAAVDESAQGSLALELKTVNHRYLEFQARIPEELRPVEPSMREAVAATLTRGKVDCRITFTPVQALARSIAPDAQAMGALAEAAKQVAVRFPDARPLSVSEVLHWPGVLADVTRICADLSISIDAIFQKEAGEGEEQVDVVILTHLAPEKNVNAAIRRIEALPTIPAPVVRIRLEELL